MSFRTRLIGILLCALVHGIWLGAGAHSLVHNHAHSHDDGAEIETAAGAPSDCPACQLSLTAPDVPVSVVLISAPQPPQFSTHAFVSNFISATAWSLPFGHAPPTA